MHVGRRIYVHAGPAENALGVSSSLPHRNSVMHRIVYGVGGRISVQVPRRYCSRRVVVRESRGRMVLFQNRARLAARILLSVTECASCPGSDPSSDKISSAQSLSRPQTRGGWYTTIKGRILEAQLMESDSPGRFFTWPLFLHWPQILETSHSVRARVKEHSSIHPDNSLTCGRPC